jgi:hypothetical protein
MTTVRLLARNVPTTVGADELYDAVATHHGGWGMRDALMLPAASSQPYTQALLDYESPAAADAALAAELYIDDVLVQLSKMGAAPQPNGGANLAAHKPSSVDVTIGGFGPATSPAELFELLRPYDATGLHFSATAGSARVRIERANAAALEDAVTQGRIGGGLFVARDGGNSHGPITPLAMHQQQHHQQRQMPPQHQQQQQQQQPLPAFVPPPPGYGVLAHQQHMQFHQHGNQHHHQHPQSQPHARPPPVGFVPNKFNAL